MSKLSDIAFERYEALYEDQLYKEKAYEMLGTEHQAYARRKVYEAIIAECSKPELPETMPEVHDTLIDAERYRYLRKCGPEERITVAEYATDGYLLDHFVDKGRCGL